MFDLQTRVHLEEEELFVLIDELDGAGVVVTDGLGRLDCGLAHGLLDTGGHAVGGSFLDELLMSSLRRAIPRADPHDVAVLVADDLHLDVTRPCEIALEIDLVPTEEGLRLALGAVHRLLHVRFGAHHLHATAAAAIGGFDSQGVAVFCAERSDLVGRCHELRRARHDRRAATQRCLPRADLVAHLVDRFRWRADECDTLGRDGPGEVGDLAEEPVPRVHRVGATAIDCFEDGRGVEVALRRGLSAQRVRLVGQANVERVAVELAVDRHRLDAEIARRTNHANGDLSTVGDQDLCEHGCQSWSMTTPGATWHVIVVDETGSTNADLLDAAADGASDRTVLRARNQTAGKGRLGRQWSAPPGTNLLVSLLFREVPSNPHELTQRVALAAVAACSEIAAVAATLKWPNDLLVEGRKLAGILAQAGAASGS